jgi:hypothetical protein
MNQREAIADKVRKLELSIFQSEDLLAQFGRSIYTSEAHPGSGDQDKSSRSPLKFLNENTHSSKGSEESPDRVSSFENPQKTFEIMLNPIGDIKRTQSFTPKSAGMGQGLKLRKQISTPGPRVENVFSVQQMLAPETIDIAIVYTSPLVEAVEKNQAQFTQLLACDDYDFCDDVYQYVSLIKKTKISLKLLIERISIDQFIKVLEKQPRVLHLLCHCDWDQEKGEYYLCFQNEKLELLKVNLQKLESMIKMVTASLYNISLLILSAPFAEV